MSAITFDPSVGYGTIITTVLLVSGFVGNWAIQKYQVKEALTRHLELETRVTLIDQSLQAHKLEAANHFVRRDDVERLEDRLGKMFSVLIEGIGRRLDTVEHTTRNIDTKIVSIMSIGSKGRLRDD